MNYIFKKPLLQEKIDDINGNNENEIIEEYIEGNFNNNNNVSNSNSKNVNYNNNSNNKPFNFVVNKRFNSGKSVAYQG